MVHRSLIAIAAGLISLAAVPLSANADPYGHRDGYRGKPVFHGRHIAPAPHVFSPRRPHFDRYHYRRDWHPRPRWHRWSYWR